MKLFHLSAFVIALAVSQTACTQAEKQANTPTEKQTGAPAQKQTETDDIGFSTSKFPYTVPEKVVQACEAVEAKLPAGERSENGCMEVDIQLLKTRHAWLDKIVNKDFGDPEKSPNVIKNLNETADSVYEELQEVEVGNANRYTQTRAVVLLGTSPRLNQIAVDDYVFSGGAHGTPSKAFFVFDMDLKKRLNISDILLSPSQKTELEKLVFQQFEAFIKQYAQAQDMPFSDQDFAEHQETWKFALNDNFYFSPKGLTFSYDPYELGPYSMGFFVLTVDKEKLNGIVKPEYLSQTWQNFDDQKIWRVWE